MRSSTLAFACALYVTGCGTDPGAVDNFIKQLAQAQCQWEFRCCTDPEIKQKEGGKFMDEATCEKFAQLALKDGLYLERLGVSQGRLTVDDTHAQACVAKQAMKACNPGPGSPPPPPTKACDIDPCAQVFAGNTGAGNACLIASECAKGSQCVGAGAGTEGVCVPFQTESQICNSSADCDPSVCNLYCARQDFQCHVRSPIGGPCAYTISPVSGNPTTPLLLECDDSTNNVYCDPGTSTCQTLPTAGQPCLSPAPPGVFNSCDPDPALELFCDNSGGGGMGICRGPGMAGDDCSKIQCSAKSMLFCDHSTTPPRCKSLPTLGQQCNTSFQCQQPYFCNTMVNPAVCAQPAQLGQPCSFNLRCDTTLYCDMTAGMPTCQARLADGSPCTQSQMCLSSVCTFTGGTMQVCAPSTTTVQCIGR